MVEYVTIRNKKYPIRIGYFVMKTVKEKTGKSLQEAFAEAKDDITLHEIILFAALKMGAYAQDEELDLKEEDMPMILDMCFNDYLKAFKSDKFHPSKEEMGEDEIAEPMGEEDSVEQPVGKGKTLSETT